MGYWRDFNDRGSECEPLSGGKVFNAQIQVEVQLVSRQRPSLFCLRDQSDDTSVHDVQLHIGVRLSIDRVRISSGSPVISHESVLQAELCLGQLFSLSGTR